jgi:hypothetical protein
MGRLPMNAPHFTIADLDALSHLTISAGYRLLRNRVESELERRRAELERDLDIVNTAECRGRIGALRTVLEIPVILRDEMKNQIAEDTDNGI